MKDPKELAKQCEDADIFRISVSSTYITFWISGQRTKGLVYLHLPRSLNLQFMPDTNQTFFENPLQFEVFILRDFFGPIYLVEMLEENILRISHCIVGTMFSITAQQNIECPSPSWELVEAQNELEPPYDQKIDLTPPRHYLEELMGMKLEKIDYLLDSSRLFFKSETEERILFIYSIIEFAGESLNFFERFKDSFPDDEMAAWMSTLAGCIDSKVQGVEIQNSGDLAIEFDNRTKFIAVEKAPPGNPYFEDSWALQNAKTLKWLAGCTDGEGV